MKELVQRMAQMLREEFNVDPFSSGKIKSKTLVTYAKGAIVNAIYKTHGSYHDGMMVELIGRGRTTILYYRHQHSPWMVDDRYLDMFDACLKMADEVVYKEPFSATDMLRLARCLS